MQIHRGQIQNQIIQEEHDGLQNAKRTSLVSAATIYVVTDVTVNPALGSRATIGNVSVINTATQIVAADTNRRSLTLQNISNATIFTGNDDSVTSSNGIKLQQDDVQIIDNYDGAVFGIADATGHSIRFFAELD
ncbi:MAG: hypothetical protein ACXABY_33990 [Candidatus Thorarchaeota archaeon]|jgi:hypothetical protein